MDIRKPGWNRIGIFAVPKCDRITSIDWPAGLSGLHVVIWTAADWLDRREQCEIHTMQRIGSISGGGQPYSRIQFVLCAHSGGLDNYRSCRIS